MIKCIAPWVSRMVLLVAIVAGGSLNTACVSDSAVISQANEFHSSLQPTVIEDPVLRSYIQRVGDRIIAAARQMHDAGEGPADSDWMFSEAMQFHLVNSDTINAFTTGGNHMYVYTGLFQMAKSEDELAAVMAHEFAHVYGRHVHQGMKRQYTVLGGALLAGVAGYAAGGKDRGMEYAGYSAGAAMVAGQLLNMGFTRKDEAEADELGFEFYVRAGWDPDRFGDFFQQMIDQGYDTNGKFEEFLSDHPSLASRVEVARQRAASISPSVRERLAQPPVATPREFEALKRRAQDISASLPKDKTLAGTQDLLQALPRSCLTPAVAPDQKEAAQRLEERMEAQAKAEKKEQEQKR